MYQLNGQIVDRSEVVDALIEMVEVQDILTVSHLARNKWQVTFARKEVMETIGKSSEHSIEDHLNEIEIKVKGAIQTTMHIEGDENFRGIEMETIWI